MVEIFTLLLMAISTTVIDVLEVAALNSMILFTAQVDEVGHQIQQAHKWVPKQWRAMVPDEAIDQCEASYDAADGNKQKAAMECFDDTGIMALICCHDISLFFANIDTPSVWSGLSEGRGQRQPNNQHPSDCNSQRSDSE